jgi:hypothetical protein
MANKADVTVKNTMKDQAEIKAFRKLQDGSSDLDTTIAYHKDHQIHLPTPDESLVISAPDGKETKDYFVIMKSDVDMEIVYSRSKANWTFKIIPNELPPDTPTTVNVEIGDKEPD